MAYTYDQLVLAYKAVHDGIAPDQIAQNSLQGWAMLNSAGQMTDAQVIGNVVNTADSTTAVAVLAYQFFTGKSPTAAGLDYLVNSANNPNDLNDAYYAQFNLENRYINFAANLGVNGAGAANFATKYGSLSYGDFVASIYETIIGSSYAQSAGVNVTAAIASIVSRQAAILASSGANTAGLTAAQIDIATKAATVGYLLGEAVKSDVGLYAASNNNFMLALMQGNAVYNTDITLTYKPTPDTGAHGTTGQAIDRGPITSSLPTGVAPPTTPTVPAGPPVVHNFVATAGPDVFIGQSLNDTFSATDQTFGADDIYDGGGGYDTLTITGNVAGTYVVPNFSQVSNIERVNVSNSGGGVNIDTSAATGLQALYINSVQHTAAVTASSTTDANVYVNGQTGADAIQVNGGNNVYVRAIGASTGSVVVQAGNTTGDTEVERRITGAVASGSIIINGGDSITVRQESYNAANTTMTTGVVTLHGSAQSTYVNVVNAPAATAGVGVAGVINSAVTVTDYNSVNHLGAGTISEIRLQGFQGASITDNALNDLWLTSGAGNVTLNNSYRAAGAVTSMNLRLFNGVNVGTIQDSGFITSLNLQTSGVNSIIGNLNFSAVTALHVMYAGSAILTSTSGLSALQTVDFNGGGLTASFGGSTLTTFDASLASFDVVVDFSAMTSAITYTDRTGLDQVTVNSLANTLNFNNGGIGDKVTIVTAGTAAVGGFTTIQGSALPLVGFTAHGTEHFNQTMVADQGSLRATANAAINGMADGSTNGQIAWFQYGGDTYIVESQTATHATFQDGVDYIVKLAGAVDLNINHASLQGHYVQPF